MGGVPKASSKATRNTMLANRSTDTGPEKLVRRMLREAGETGYRLHWRIDDDEGGFICRPDISFPGRKIAIFVHGCFWHRCPECDLKLPKTNTEFWTEKFDRNTERDRRNESALQARGWAVHTIWECDIDSGVDRILRG